MRDEVKSSLREEPSQTSVDENHAGVQWLVEWADHEPSVKAVSLKGGVGLVFDDLPDEAAWLRLDFATGLLALDTGWLLAPFGAKVRRQVKNTLGGSRLWMSSASDDVKPISADDVARGVLGQFLWAVAQAARSMPDR